MTIIAEDKRTERDFLGDIELPAGALYGAHTARGVENFAISGRRLNAEPRFLEAFAQIKMAAARANFELGLLSRGQADAIVGACREILAGEHRQHFIVDLFEGSGGTSLNMNVNEVIANRALILMGRQLGEYGTLHPNDHVNRSQSTNDVLPTAIKMACHEMLSDLLCAVRRIGEAFAEKSRQFADVLRLGRTCLQDAQPMTVGQAFGGYAALTDRLSKALAERQLELRTIPLGGTAIGTGLGAPRAYRALVVNYLRQSTGVAWEMPGDPFDSMQNADTFVRLSGELRTAALSLGKVASDLIILASGPAGGLGELILPALQAGSSIMPGKINPVQPMTMCQIGFAVAGNDACVAMAAQQGQLEINAYEPVIASRLFISLKILTNGIDLFARKCIAGIRVDAERSLRNLLESSAIATAMVPRLGYDRVAETVRKGASEGKPFLQVMEDDGQLDRDQAIRLIERAVGKEAREGHGEC